MVQHKFQFLKANHWRSVSRFNVAIQHQQTSLDFIKGSIDRAQWQKGDRDTQSREIERDRNKEKAKY